MPRQRLFPRRERCQAARTWRSQRNSKQRRRISLDSFSVCRAASLFGNGKHSKPLHNHEYDFNDDALPHGTNFLYKSRGTAFRHAKLSRELLQDQFRAKASACSSFRHHLLHVCGAQSRVAHGACATTRPNFNAELTACTGTIRPPLVRALFHRPTMETSNGGFFSCQAVRFVATINVSRSAASSIST
jgi:hypothetical protein